jgi:hypothetical protein
VSIAASCRFELRLPAAQAARWRTIAAERGISVADLVRAAVERALRELPADFVQRDQAAEFEAVLAEARHVISAKHNVRTFSPCARDAGENVRTTSPTGEVAP